MSPTGNDVDVVAYVRADHRTIKSLFDTIVAAAPGEREATWPDLLHSLAVHEVAEELVVFPALRLVEVRNDPEVEARLEEQREAAELLRSMEAMDPASKEFAVALGELHAAVLAHAAAEEELILPAIVRFDEVLDRASLGARYQQAKQRAPTRPHPHAPHTRPANVIGGPVLSLVDRVRDHLS